MAFSVAFKHAFGLLELKSFDLRQILTYKLLKLSSRYSEAKDKIVILSLDELTPIDLATNGYSKSFWPIGRETWAEVINFLEKGNPKVLSIAVPLNGYQDNALSQNSSDRVLARTLRKYNNIVLATTLSTPFSVSAKTDLFDSQYSLDDESEPVRTSLPIKFSDDDIESRITYFSFLHVPNMYVKNADMGYLNVKKSRDSVVRLSQPVSKVEYGNSVAYIPSFSFQTFLKYAGIDSSLRVYKNKLVVDDYAIPYSDNGDNYITWTGAGRTYNFIPFSKIVLGKDFLKNAFYYDGQKYPVEYFKDKIVIIAPTQVNVDTYKTSVDSFMSGAEINANIISNYLEGAKYIDRHRVKILREAPLNLNIILSVAFLLLIIANILIFETSILSLINSCLLVVTFVAFNLCAFVYPSVRIYFALIYPLYFMILTVILGYSNLFVLKAIEKINIKKSYGKNVPQAVLKKMLDNSAAFKAVPGKKKVTILKCSIQNGYETLGQYPLDTSLMMLNELYEWMSEIIFKHHGTIDHFGDNSMVAYWGAPIASDDDSINSINAAFDILKNIKFRKISPKSHVFDFAVNISICTGEVVISDVGPKELCSYTLFGEPVEIVSRMQDICRHFGKNIVICSSTYDEVKEKIKADFAGVIKLKGEEKQVQIFVPVMEEKND